MYNTFFYGRETINKIMEEIQEYLSYLKFNTIDKRLYSRAINSVKIDIELSKKQEGIMIDIRTLHITNDVMYSEKVNKMLYDTYDYKTYFEWLIRDMYIGIFKAVFDDNIKF